MAATPKGATPKERAKAVIAMALRGFGWAPNYWETIEARIVWEIGQAIQDERQKNKPKRQRR